MTRKVVAIALITAAGGLPLLSVAFGWAWYIDGAPIILLAVIGGYAAGALLPPAAMVPGVLAAVAGLVTANQLHSVEYHWLDDLVFFVVIVAGPAGAGAVVAVRAGQVHRLKRLQAELEEQQVIDISAARLEEQTRIQQQVHAGLAERIAGIVVRAEGAQRALDDDALAAIETEARGVLDQLRTALGFLGPQESDLPQLPEPPVARPESVARPRPSRLDLGLAVALGVALAVETVLRSDSRGPVWANVVGAMVVAAPLAVRRARPTLAVGASTLAGVAMSAWLTPIPATVTGLALLTIIFYTVGVWCRRWWWILGWLVATAGIVTMEVVSGSAEDGAGGDTTWIVVVWAVGALAVGRITAGWHERLRRTEEVVTALELGKGAAVRLAKARERQSLASELHDTVAHAMTVVCLQAGAHRRNGGDAGLALNTIGTTAATSLAELRDGLDSMEESERPLERSRIVAIGRRVGVDVAVMSRAAAPAGLAATLAFRVVREAVVNIARHAPGATAQISLDRVNGALAVEVLNDGGAAGSLISGSGKGLSGLAQAVASAGGRLEWGPRKQGGFRVAAEIPEMPP